VCLRKLIQGDDIQALWTKTLVGVFEKLPSWVARDGPSWRALDGSYCPGIEFFGRQEKKRKKQSEKKQRRTRKGYLEGYHPWGKICVQEGVVHKEII